MNFSQYISSAVSYFSDSRASFWSRTHSVICFLEHLKMDCLFCNFVLVFWCKVTFDVADFTWRSIDMNCLCLSMMIKSACVSRSCWRWRQHVMRFFTFLLFFTFFLLLPPFTFGLDFKFQYSLISWNVDHYFHGRNLPVGWLISWLCSGVLMLLLLYRRMAWGARLYFIHFFILLFIHFILLIFSSLNFLFVLSSVPFSS